MSQLPDKIEIVIAHSSPESRRKLTDAIRQIGYDIRCVCKTTDELIKVCKPTPPDLIISGIAMDGGDAIDALVSISEREPTPAIVVTPKSSLLNVEEALRDHVMAYLVEPIDIEQIKPTIYLVCERFRQFEFLKSENDDLKQTLSDRKLIERAKGILMGQHELSEDEAFRKLQKMAQTERTKLVKMALEIIESTEENAN